MKKLTALLLCLLLVLSFTTIGFCAEGNDGPGPTLTTTTTTTTTISPTEQPIDGSDCVQP